MIPSYYVSQVARAASSRSRSPAWAAMNCSAATGATSASRWAMRYARVPRWLREGVIDRVDPPLPEPKTSSDLVDHLKRFSRASSALPSPAATRIP